MTKPSVWLLLDSRSFGGIERHVDILARELAVRGIDSRIVFWSRYQDSRWARSCGAGQVPASYLNGRLGELVKALRAGRPLMLHTHGYKANIMGRLAAILTNTPVVSSFHAGLRENLPVGLYQRFDEATSFLGGRIAVSRAVQATLPFSSAMVQNFIAIPPPPAGDLFPRRAAFVGRLLHEKGIDLFCELARSIGPSIEWHVYGDGPLRQTHEDQFGDLVRFHGFVEDIEPLWRDIGLLVMPSRAEGLPMAAIEAIAHGVPVVAARVGGLFAAVQPGVSGWLFESEDLAAARRHIRAWMELSPAEQRLLRASCWGHALAEFSAEEGLRHILDVYGSQAPAFRDIRLS